MRPKPIINIENVSFSFNGSLVLDNVNLTVHEMDLLCIVGPNGGGKTTLLKLILGLLKPSTGSIQICGLAPVRARSFMGYMPQYANLDPLFPVSAMDVVLMGRLGNAKRFGFFRKVDRDAATEALKKVKLQEVWDSPFSELSGGQRQRVLIARALISNPAILLMDEPTSNVDAVSESDLYRLLSRLNKRMTVVVVTHDLGFVSSYVKRVACVNRKLLVHKTSEISGETINAIYGRRLKMVRHNTKVMEND